MGTTSRRDFMGAAGKGLAAAAILRGFPAIVPASVLGAAAPGNMINIGAIGTGRISRGHDLPGLWKHPNARIMALCDLDSKRVAETKTLVNDHYATKTGKPYDGVRTYTDYRELLANIHRAANLFRREGDYWTVAFDGQVSRVRDVKGLHHIARLLRDPDVDVPATELVAEIHHVKTPRIAAVLGDAGELLDAKAKAAVHGILPGGRPSLPSTASGTRGTGPRRHHQSEPPTRPQVAVQREVVAHPEQRMHVPAEAEDPGLGRDRLVGRRVAVNGGQPGASGRSTTSSVAGCNTDGYASARAPGQIVTS